MADQAYQAGMPELASTSAIGTVVLLLLVAVFALVPAASATVSAVRTMKEPVTDLRGALAVAAYTAVVGVAIALLLGFGAATAEAAYGVPFGTGGLSSDHMYFTAAVTCDGAPPAV